MLADCRPGALSAIGGHADLVKSEIATSLAIGGHADLVKSEITTSLAIIKETSGLVSKVPCISPIAGLLLYLIQVYDVRVLS